MQFPFRLDYLIPFWRTSDELRPPKYNFTLGDDVFSPMDLVSMSKPGTAFANPAGDLFLLPIKTYNATEVDDRHSILISSLGAAGQHTHELVLGERDSVFWLDSRTIAHVAHIETEESPYEQYDLKALSLDLKDSSEGHTGYLRVLSSSLIATLPTLGALDFQYLPQAQRLVFYDQISKDGYFPAYGPEEEAEQLEDPPPFFGSMFERLDDSDLDSRDERPALLSVSLSKTDDGSWALGTDYIRLTPHEPLPEITEQHAYDLSEARIIYAIDAEVEPSGCMCGLELPHDIYVNSIDGSTTARRIAKARSVTSPRLNNAGAKAAWFEDNVKIVIYDLLQDVEFTLIDRMDVHPTSLVFSEVDDTLYFTGGNDIMVSVYSLPVPEIPLSAPLDPHPVPTFITETTSLRGLQALPNGSLLATLLSYASPNEVVLIRDPQGSNLVEQITHVNDGVIRRTNLTGGEAFDIPGIDNAHGWIFKAKDWVKDDGIKRPAILIHYKGEYCEITVVSRSDVWGLEVPVHGVTNGPSYQTPIVSLPSTIVCLAESKDRQVFAAQGFFVVLISTNPLPRVCSSDPQRLKKLSAGWNHVLSTYPEIDCLRTIFIDEDLNETILRAVTDSGSRHGFQFKLAFGTFSTGHNLYFQCLDRDDVYRAYDFLQSVAQ
ncbi:hypothetical protein PLEOSDRAFT_1102336 [Pleurotus ostreatus PC15]|uniref:Uncharacterized protein n=1 Tax=Pleurotus ostreatus (strain PC15) TaxID=1137138 RepID=A0A067NTZ9_PLEO1|nr:hypothetical protein PLEOSDRAFT_1102336 [Pleurotus ostreatus PC15]